MSSILQEVCNEINKVIFPQNLDPIDGYGSSMHTV